MSASPRIIDELEKNMNEVWKKRDKQKPKVHQAFCRMLLADRDSKKWHSLREQYLAARSELQALNDSLDAAVEAFIEASKLGDGTDERSRSDAFLDKLQKIVLRVLL